MDGLFFSAIATLSSKEISGEAANDIAVFKTKKPVAKNENADLILYFQYDIQYILLKIPIYK